MAASRKRAGASRRLVIDANVLGEAGNQPDPGSRGIAVRAFLGAVLGICHRVVLTPAIRDEWKRHASSFARKWRVSMEGRKKIIRLDAPEDARLRKQFARAIPVQRDKEAALKDVHLIEAARAADGIVASLDERARQIFASACEAIPDLASLTWVNPACAAEGVPAWLEAGARTEQARTLGRFVRKGKLA